ncbi:hypothetical protein FORC17_1011 [Vibrio vulnificus]|nr:hypothetical protein FORC17_1011 [Vibrio vulnificus]
MEVSCKQILLVDYNIELAKSVMEYLEMHGIHSDRTANGVLHYSWHDRMSMF